jgi:WD40 repeat protein
MTIFLSYARADAAPLAQRLARDLPDAWLDILNIGGGTVWSQEIEKVLDHSDTLVIALLTPGSFASEICRAEHLRALRQGRRLIPVLAAPSTERPLYLEARHYRDFSDPARYDESLRQLRADIESGERATLAEPYRVTRVTYVTAPPQVANYLDRPDALRALRDTLFSPGQRKAIALTGLAGMGGIGKTALAKALTEDAVVQQAFPDGIVWITAGREGCRDFVQEMREVAKALGDDLSRYDNGLACEHQYRTTMANKAALVVVDDVWSVADLKPLLAESPRSRFLFTTRDASIGRFVAAREHTAQQLEREQARELLAAWADVPVAELPTEADAVIAECRGLPLALSVVGAMLRGADDAVWWDTVGLLRKADLSAIDDQLPDGQESFFRAVEVSYQALKPAMQERYRDLAVLLEDMPAPLPVLQTLWGGDEAEARRISRHFVDRSLAWRDGDGIRLHDLQLDYVRALYPDKDVLELIHGAMRLSAHVIARDPRQFASQMVGRLLSFEELRPFVARVASRAPGPWIRPLQPVLRPPGTALVRTLEGHSQWVSSVTMTADGRRAVSASADNTLKVWDLETGRQLCTLEGHSDVVNGVAVSADGRRAVSASRDKTLIIWDLDTGSQLRTLEGHSKGVNGVALSGDGRRAVSASSDETLIVWDLETGRELCTLGPHWNKVKGVAVSLDGRRAVSASWDTTLKVWDLEIGSELCTLEGHSGGVNAVALSGDGRSAVSADERNTLKVWDLESGREMRTLEGHSDVVDGVAVSADGRRAVSASRDKTLIIWDLDTGSQLRTLEGHSEGVNGVALSGDGRRAVSASSDNTLKVWELEAGRRPRTLQTPHSYEVNSMAVSADGRYAVSASNDATLKLWDVENGRQLRSLERDSLPFISVAVSPNGRRAVSGSWDKSLRLWELETGRELRALWGHLHWVLGIAISSDGRRAVSASADHTLKVWDLETSRELRTLEGHSDWVRDVAVSADGRRAVSASDDHTLKVWDLETGRQLRTLEGHTDRVNGVAVSADGRRAVSASWDQTLKVWDLETGDELRTLEGHSDGVNGVAVSPDMRRAASASSDKTLKVWDLKTGEALATFTADASLSCCTFAGAQTILAGDALGHVHFLKLEQ